MAKYELTNKAVEDLTEIWKYTCEEWSEQQVAVAQLNLSLLRMS
jgi:plasmid stabilization system protein ParE